MKFVISSLLLLFTWQAHATPITPDNLVGRYKVQANLGFQKYYAHLHVLNNREFELQRVYPDGKKGEVCNGEFALRSLSLEDQFEFFGSTVMTGKVSCPSDRSQVADFNIDFRSAQIEDLSRGTNVTITSSMARGMKVSAHIKKH